MNNYQDWAQLVAKKLEHESTLLAAIDKDELDDAAATEAFVRAVLEPFLPETFGIGSGRIVDAYGNYSEYLDIIVFNKNYPRIGMRGTHSAYLYESVLAAFAIRAKFVRKSFAEALNACASLADLESPADKIGLQRMAMKNGLKPGPDNTWVHQDPLQTARFELLGRPLSFVFGFSGFKFSHRQLQENIELWFENRGKSGVTTSMKCLPAVIATQGCFAWRNAAPLQLSNRKLLGIGNDDAPVRLIVLQLLYLLNRRLQVAIDGYGLKPSLDRYLSHFSVPKFEAGVGNVAEVVKLAAGKGVSSTAKAAAAKSAAKANPTASADGSPPADDSKPTASSQPAAAANTEAKAKPAASADGSPPADDSKPAASSQPAAAANTEAKANPAASADGSPPADDGKPAASSKPAATAKPAAAKPAAEAKPAEPEQRPATPEQKPAVAAKPAPEPAAKSESKPAAPAEKSAHFESSGVFDKPSPFASKPKPESPTEDAKAPEPRRSPPSQPLGSAPIPPSTADTKPGDPSPLEKPSVPPLDITLDGDTFAELTGQPSEPAASEPADGDPAVSTLITSPGEDDPKPAEAESSTDSNAEDWSNEEMQSTVIITPDASLSANEKSKKSGDEFIEKVKKQMSSPEPIGED